MDKFRLSIIIFGLAASIVISIYFIAMYLDGKTHLSSNPNDWANFGSYVGGILTPFAALLTGYQIYKSFSLSTYTQKIMLIRDSLQRLDNQLETMLNQPFNNDCHGEYYFGKTIKQIIIAISNNHLDSNKESSLAFLVLFHNITIYCEAFSFYIKAIENFPTDADNSKWLEYLEKAHWIQKYAPICERMRKIIGEDQVKNKCTPEQFACYEEMLGRSIN